MFLVSRRRTSWFLSMACVDGGISSSINLERKETALTILLARSPDFHLFLFPRFRVLAFLA